MLFSAWPWKFLQQLVFGDQLGGLDTQHGQHGRQSRLSPSKKSKPTKELYDTGGSSTKKRPDNFQGTAPPPERPTDCDVGRPEKMRHVNIEPTPQLTPTNACDQAKAR